MWNWSVTRRNGEGPRLLAQAYLLTQDAGPDNDPDVEMNMRRVLVCAAATVLTALPAFAALPNGTRAPAIDTQATLAGKEFKFSLAEALKKGPVVLYFYPAAFT